MTDQLRSVGGSSSPRLPLPLSSHCGTACASFATTEAPDDHDHYGVNFGPTGRSPKQGADGCCSGKMKTLSVHKTQVEKRSGGVGAGGCDRRAQ
jgi:hypothetical protein